MTEINATHFLVSLPFKQRPFKRSVQILKIVALTLASLTFSQQIAQAVPSFARQTGMSCIACHTEFPILNDFGRQFKINGYTMSTGQTELPPIAIMLQPSFTRTNKGQSGGAAPHFGDNSNTALSQASIFYSGRLFGPYAEKVFAPETAEFLNKFGAFIQGTYDGVNRQIHWDNVELRYADHATLAGKPVTYGFYMNNNPSMQDPWNTLPVWTFPFSSSGLAPTPGASTLIDGGLSQQVIGLGVYTLLANSVYLDVGGYRTASTGFQRSMGIDPNGQTQVAGVAPYWRAAYTKSIGNQSMEIGIFGLSADTYPGRERTAGKDRIFDWGFDSQYQVSLGSHDITALFSRIQEHSHWNASQSLGAASNSEGRLWTTKVAADYLYNRTYGGLAGFFHTNGTSDAALRADSATGSPLNDGMVFQLNYLPFNVKGGPAFWPKSSVKISLQYIMYNRFNGGHSNYDGSGRNASDNNTLYLETWIAF